MNVSFLIELILLLCFDRLGVTFSLDHSSECLLCLVFEYHLCSFVVYQTLWVSHIEWMVIIIVCIIITTIFKLLILSLLLLLLLSLFLLFIVIITNFRSTFLPWDLSPTATASHSPQRLKQTDNKPFTGQIGLRHVTLSQAVAHQN